MVGELVVLLSVAALGVVGIVLSCCCLMFVCVLVRVWMVSVCECVCVCLFWFVIVSFYYIFNCCLCACARRSSCSRLASVGISMVRKCMASLPICFTCFVFSIAVCSFVCMHRLAWCMVSITSQTAWSMMCCICMRFAFVMLCVIGVYVVVFVGVASLSCLLTFVGLCFVFVSACRCWFTCLVFLCQLSVCDCVLVVWFWRCLLLFASFVPLMSLCWCFG